MISAWTNHLWQSTLFALGAGFLTFACQKNRANVRYWIWFAASFKFLLPFGLLMDAGNRIWQAAMARHFAATIQRPGVSVAIARIAQPFSAFALPGPAPAHASAQPYPWFVPVIASVWMCGVLAVVVIRFRGWLQIRHAMRQGTAIPMPIPVAVLSVPGVLEPGVVGFFRPVLLLPEKLVKSLNPAHLQAVIAHEMTHVRRRDNLTAAIHMVIEALFWFYPLVWWIGTKLVEEREKACDEAVVELGSEPQEYADAILKVCTFYMDSPLACVAGISGANLKRRVQAILTANPSADLNPARKVALIAAAVAALAIPLAVGMLDAPSIRAQSHPLMPAIHETQATPVAASDPANDYLSTLGMVTATSVVVRPRIDGLLTSVSFKEGDTVQAGQVLASIDSHNFDAQLAEAQSQLTKDEAQFAWLREAPSRGEKEREAGLAQWEGTIKSDQAKLEAVKLLISYAQVTAPMTGIVGLRRVDPGNMVRATDADGIATINQIKPIAVIFNPAADSLPQVLARLNKRNPVTVEAWSSDYTRKLANGSVIAVDNQIDSTTGTVKVKATFDNKDGALFPNEFVNVRLLLKMH